MQQYMTLEEAAKYLQMSPDELRDMAKKKTIRAFQDRGSWRFRSQDIEELARTRGLGSDPALQLGEGKKPPSTIDPKKPGKAPADADLLPVDFEFDDDDSDEVPIGKEKFSSPGPRSGKSGRTPKPGSDSDVRLVDDSKVSPAAKSPSGVSPKPGSGKKKKPTGLDSGVRLVGGTDEASDSDVKLEPSSKDSGVGKKGARDPSDSDIRLDNQPPSGRKRGPDAGIITEEIDLDAEEAKMAESQQLKKPGKQARPTHLANQPGLPTQSPFELSEPDMNLDKPKKGQKPGAGKKADDSSSDFELIPFDASKSPVELGSGEIPLLEGDEEVALGSEVSGPNAGNSGINLRDPADSGLSLESGGSDEFELSLDSGPSIPVAKGGAKSGPKSGPKGGPKSGPKKVPPIEEDSSSSDDSSSDFELSLDDSGAEDSSSSEFELSIDEEAAEASEVDSSSEFELSLEDSGDGVEVKPDESSSDSEFELTLDDEGGLAVDEESGGDIFEETNFDVPALDDESGSEAVAIDESDTDLEGSDFEISLDDDSASGDDSGSQVVALEDEEADDAAATVAKPRKTTSKSKAAAAAALADDDEPVSAGDLDVDLDAPPRSKRRAQLDDDEDSDEAVPAGAVAVESDWGPLPAIMLFPTVLVLFLVGVMGFELLRGMWGFHRATPIGSPVINNIARMFDDTLPK